MVVTVLKVGLKETEVLDSRQKYGSNKLTEVESEGFKKKLIKNLGDPMIKILCFALFINIIFTYHINKLSLTNIRVLPL